MAALNLVHWETTTPELQRVFAHLAHQPILQQFYLAGGTAVALRLGHRRSHDLDYFSATNEVLAPTRRAAAVALAEFEPTVVEDADGTFVLDLGALQVAFLGYGYDLAGEPDVVDGVAVASLTDLGLMKLDALISRGSRKDFYDLYFILQQRSLPELMSLAELKYPHAHDFELMAVASLALFENADRDQQPEMLVEVAWPTVRSFFRDLARERGQSWL